jgi:hypothetical protein
MTRCGSDEETNHIEFIKVKISKQNYFEEKNKACPLARVQCR